jgi:elongation factor Ts
MSQPITTELVKELRDQTGISVMQCRKALEEAEGDLQKALAILKKNSANIAEKKADRSATDGAVTVKSDATHAVLVTLNCETDFVAKNEDFTMLLSKLGDIALKDGIEKMKTQAKELIDPVIQKTGEKIELGPTFEITGDTIGSYVHNGKIAVVVSLTGGNAEVARDVAMHTAAMKPEYMTSADVTPDAMKIMAEVFEKEVAGQNKPEEIKKKILQGKMDTYFKEKTLVEQPFIKNASENAGETVGQMLMKNKASLKEVKRSVI